MRLIGMCVALMPGMKTTFQKTLLVVLLITLFASIGFAKESNSIEQTTYRKLGFHTGVEVDLLIPILEDEDDTIILPKLDLVLGSQFSSYFAVDLKLSTVMGLLWMAELAPKINFTNTRVSPFITGSVIGAGVLIFEEKVGGFVYSAGAGVDLNITKNAQLTGMVRMVRPFDSEHESMILPQLGVQFIF